MTRTANAQMTHILNGEKNTAHTSPKTAILSFYPNTNTQNAHNSAEHKLQDTDMTEANYNHNLPKVTSSIKIIHYVIIICVYLSHMFYQKVLHMYKMIITQSNDNKSPFSLHSI